MSKETEAMITTKPWVVFAITVDGLNKTYFGCCKDVQKRFKYLRVELQKHRNLAPKYLEADFAEHKKTADDLHFWIIMDDLSEADAYLNTGELIRKYHTDDPAQGWNVGRHAAGNQKVHIHKGLPSTLIGKGE